MAKGKSGIWGVAPIAVMLALLGMPESAAATGVSIGASGAFFRPAADLFREVYGNGPAFAGHITVPVGKNLGVWAGVKYFGKSGRLTFTGEPTKIRITSFYGGLELSLSWRAAKPYLGAAAGYFLYREQNILGAVSGGCLGFLGQLGLLVRVAGPVSLDFFSRYNWAKAKPQDSGGAVSQIGGVEVGIGLVVEF